MRISHAEGKRKWRGQLVAGSVSPCGGKRNGEGEKSPADVSFYRGSRDRGGDGEPAVTGLVEIDAVPAPLFPVGLVRGMVGLKSTRATVPLDRTQLINPTIFLFSKLTQIC
jgi:hypothetical protein